MSLAYKQAQEYVKRLCEETDLFSFPKHSKSMRELLDKINDELRKQRFRQGDFSIDKFLVFDYKKGEFGLGMFCTWRGEFISYISRSRLYKKSVQFAEKYGFDAIPKDRSFEIWIKHGRRKLAMISPWSFNSCDPKIFEEIGKEIYSQIYRLKT